MVTRFNEQHDSYRTAEYRQTITLCDFIDPFFKALGWDNLQLTIGKKIEVKSAVEIASLRIVDRARGNGSFLPGADQYLPDHYRAQYAVHHQS